MKISLLFLITFCISTSFFAQTQGKTFKLKNKTGVPYSTTFTPIAINGQSSIKSTKFVNTPSVYQNIGTSILNFQAKKADDNKIIYGADSVTPIYFERKNTSHLKSTNLQNSTQQCFEFLEGIKHDLHIVNPSECFTITDSKVDNLGQHHIRLSQNYNGIKVYSSEFYVHFAGDKEILNGKYSIIDSSINTVPKISKEQALQIAFSDLKAVTSIVEFTDAQKDFFNYREPGIDTVILEDKHGFTKNNLAYHISIRPNMMDEWYYFVNAANGHIIKKYNNTKYDGPTTATATDLNGVAHTVNTYLEKGNYKLVDASEPMFNAAKNEGLIITLDAQNTDGNKFAEITTANNTWSNPTAVSAHYNAQQAYLYFKNTFNRNSINGSGGNIYSFINVTNADGTGLDNAFWSDKIMYYGNGNSSFKPLSGGLDVASHEMAHGITQNTAALE